MELSCFICNHVRLLKLSFYSKSNFFPITSCIIIKPWGCWDFNTWKDNKAASTTGYLPNAIPLLLQGKSWLIWTHHANSISLASNWIKHEQEIQLWPMKQKGWLAGNRVLWATLSLFLNRDTRKGRDSFSPFSGLYTSALASGTAEILEPQGQWFSGQASCVRMVM